MSNLKLPQAFLTAAATVSEKTKATAKVTAGGKAVTARIDMSAEVAGAGNCPECKKPMKPAMSNGMPVLYCYEHRIAIPTADEGGAGATTAEV